MFRPEYTPPAGHNPEDENPTAKIRQILRMRLVELGLINPDADVLPEGESDEQFGGDTMLESRHSEGWAPRFRLSPLAREFLTKELNGGVLIDLGGGRNSYERKIAHDIGIGQYISVDVSLRHSVDEASGDMFVYGDMLKFVSQMRDDAANFSIDGIDHIVIRDLKYHEDLATEIERATKAGGIIYGVNSEISEVIRERIAKGETVLEERSLDLATKHSSGSNYFIFQKPEESHGEEQADLGGESGSR